MQIASKYGALSIRNLGQALRAAQALIGRIPTWSDNIDRPAIKAARKDFEDQFPNIDKVRHSIAHPELYSAPHKSMGTVVKSVPKAIKADSPIVVMSGMFERTYFATFEGAEVSYDLTADTALKLKDIIRRCFEAVPDVPRT
jgi:hypothetical protein